MKHNKQQKQWLKERLLTVLKYRETYEEVYDHILLAFERRPHARGFENAVNSVIIEDFGGDNGLMTMERKCRNAVITEVKRQYWAYFYAYLKFPYLTYTVVIAVILGYIAIHISYHVLILSGTIWAFGAIMIPVLLFEGRKFKISYNLQGPLKMHYFFSYLKLPLVYVVVVSIILGYIAIRVSYNVIAISESIWVLGAAMIPVLWFAGRKLKASDKSGGPLKFLKDRILARLVNKPFQLLFWCILLSLTPHDAQIFNSQAGFDLWQYIGPLIFIIMFVTATIHSLSFIRLMKDEFKFSIRG